MASIECGSFERAGPFLCKLIHQGSDGTTYQYDFYDVTKLGATYRRLPIIKKILLECAVRKCHSSKDPDQVKVWRDTANALLNDTPYRNKEDSDKDETSKTSQPILFHPGRVVLQDFTSVAALVDLAALRDEVANSGGDPSTVDSLCPADLVVDNFAQVDYSHIKSVLHDHKVQQQQQQADGGVSDQPRSLQPSRGAPALPALDQQFSQMSLQQPPPPPMEPHQAPPPLPAVPTNIPPIIHHTFPPGAFYPPAYFLPYPVQPLPPPCGHVPTTDSPGFGPVPPPPPPPMSPHRQPMSPPPPPNPLPSRPSSSGNSVDKSAPPNDNPGLPVQDSICPFHQHMSHWAKTLDKNQKVEMEKNSERFAFLKWVDAAFKNITVVPPGTGTLHQLNLEYLARVVTCQNDVLFPDSVVGTDNHTGMVNGLGVLGWKVGTLDAEAVMFGHPLTLPALPKVLGVKLIGTLAPYSTSTDLVMLITRHLRKRDGDPAAPGGAAGCRSKDADSGGESSDVFVEFFGPSVSQLSVADRSAVSNLCSEYGAVAAYFPIDDTVIKYLAKIGRPEHQISVVQTYLKRVEMFRNQSEEFGESFDYDSVVTIDLGQVHVSVSGPKKAKDRVALSEVAKDFKKCLKESYSSADPSPSLTVDIDGRVFTVRHGSVLMASIASCTNTSNPTVMLTAGLLAKKAVEAGLSVPKYINTSLAPGSGVVTAYLKESGVMPYLYMLGFEVVGYGCAKCVENSSRSTSGAHPALIEAVKANSLVCVGVLSGNRNFEGRFEPGVKANYLTSAPMVVAFALAGRVDIDFEKEPLGCATETVDGSNGKPVHLRDIWPSPAEIQEVERNTVIPAIFNQLRQSMAFGNEEWSSLEVGGEGGDEEQNTYQFAWNPQSTYIRPPRYVRDLIDAEKLTSFSRLRCLAKFGDDVTSDHISPAGSIVRNSPAADYLANQGLAPRQFNSYGSRRGNWEVMAAGTFSHLKLKNLILETGGSKGTSKAGPYTLHQPSRIPTSMVDAAAKYRQEKEAAAAKGGSGSEEDPLAINGLIVVAGVNFGRGAPRDWATKGPLSLGVRVVLAVSFDPMYRANLVKTGILPLEISQSDFDGICGSEMFSINLNDHEEKPLTPRETVDIKMTDHKTDSKTERVIPAVLGLYNEYEIGIFRNGGVIRDMFRRLNEKKQPPVT